jgi:hypothetical protein
MTIQEWTKLSLNEKTERVKILNPHDSWEIFKYVERNFIEKYCDFDGFVSASCGLVGFGANVILVRKLKGSKRKALSKSFDGFPLILEYVETTL